MRLRSLVLRALACSVLLASALVAPVGSAPPPAPVCEACGDEFADALRWHGERHGLDADRTTTGVARSVATVHLAGNGTATWTVRNRLTSEAAVRFLRGNETALADVAEYAAPGPVRDARVATNGTVVLRYRTPDLAAAAPGGVVRFAGLRETHLRRFSGLGADRLVVRGPPGTVARGTDADTDGNAVLLTAIPDDGGFVTFAPPGVAGDALHAVAVADAVWWNVARNLLVGVLLPTAVLLALVAATTRLAGRPARRDGRLAETAAVVGALGCIPLAALVAVGPGHLFVVAGTVCASHVALAALAVVAARSKVRPTLPRAAAGVALASLAGFVATLAATAVVQPWYLSRLAALNYYAVDDAVFAASAGLLVLSSAVAGYAAGTGTNRRVAVAAPAVTLAVGLAASTSFASPPGSSVLGVYGFVAFAVAIPAVVAVLGLPAFFLGRAVPAAVERADGGVPASARTPDEGGDREL